MPSTRSYHFKAKARLAGHKPVGGCDGTELIPNSQHRSKKCLFWLAELRQVWLSRNESCEPLQGGDDGVAGSGKALTGFEVLITGNLLPDPSCAYVVLWPWHMEQRPSRGGFSCRARRDPNQLGCTRLSHPAWSAQGSTFFKLFYYFLIIFSCAIANSAEPLVGRCGTHGLPGAGFGVP